jgi:Na+/H+ antiporter NhaD/arsenite permease-like protein
MENARGFPSKTATDKCFVFALIRNARANATPTSPPPTMATSTFAGIDELNSLVFFFFPKLSSFVSVIVVVDEKAFFASLVENDDDDDDDENKNRSIVVLLLLAPSRR